MIQFAAKLPKLCTSVCLILEATLYKYMLKEKDVINGQSCYPMK